MSAATADRVRLGPGRVLASEWLKLVTVRSTFWTSAVALVLGAATVAAIGGVVAGQGRLTERAVPADLLIGGATVSLTFVGLVVGVLGVLAVGGEYATLQIRSSYTAVPRRWPSLVAKGIVVGLWSFALGLVIDFGGLGVLAAFFGASGAEVDVTPAVVGALVAGAASIAVLGAFSVGLGALVRSSAAGITILTALLFVAPIVLNLLASLLRADWAATAADYLLGTAAADLRAAPGGSPLELWAVVLTLAAWLAAAWVPALLLTLRRDV